VEDLFTLAFLELLHLYEFAPGVLGDRPGAAVFGLESVDVLFGFKLFHVGFYLLFLRFKTTDGLDQMNLL
jgi:hypothetical protein